MLATPVVSAAFIDKRSDVSHEVIETHAAAVASCLQRGSDAVPWNAETDAIGLQRQLASWADKLEKIDWEAERLTLMDGEAVLPVPAAPLSTVQRAEDAAETEVPAAEMPAAGTPSGSLVSMDEPSSEDLLPVASVPPALQQPAQKPAEPAGLVP